MSKKITPKNAKKAAGSKSKANAKDITSTQLYQLIALLEQEMNGFIYAERVDVNLSGKDRQRLISSGVRNNGFIDKAFDIALDNPNFMPPHFSVQDMTRHEQRFEQLRQLMYILQQFQQLAANAFMVQSDICYREALRVYGSLREQARAKVPGAEELFRALLTFFRRRRHVGEEPTERELQLDFKKLVSGKADGKIVVENEKPRTIGGVRKVVDKVRSGRAAFKETAEAEE